MESVAKKGRPPSLTVQTVQKPQAAEASEREEPRPKADIDESGEGGSTLAGGDDDELFFATAAGAGPAGTPGTTGMAQHNELQEKQDDVRVQVKAFLQQLSAKEQKTIVDQLLRRIANGEPLSARRLTDQVDESCEFLGELLEFCNDTQLAECVLKSTFQSGDLASGDLEGSAQNFLASRRQYRLTPVRVIGPWEEVFAKDGQRYFYNNQTQRTQWEVPEGWPEDTPEDLQVQAGNDS